MKYVSIKKFFPVAAVAVALLTTQASAATYTVNFNGSAFPVPQLNFVNAGGSGLNLNVTASDYANTNGTPTGGAFNLGQYTGGIGICSGTATTSGDGCSSDSHYVDGYNGDEMAFFNFGAGNDVSLTSIGFYVPSFATDPEFDFALYLGADAPLWVSQVDVVSNSGGFKTYNLSTPRTGSLFGIGASGTDDYFKVSSITFDYDVSAVPVPAAGFLLFGALGGLAAMRRRRKSV
jgi:hypothetical protein